MSELPSKAPEDKALGDKALEKQPANSDGMLSIPTKVGPLLVEKKGQKPIVNNIRTLGPEEYKKITHGGNASEDKYASGHDNASEDTRADGSM